MPQVYQVKDSQSSNSTELPLRVLDNGIHLSQSARVRYGRLSCAILVVVSGCGQDCTVVGCGSGILVDSAAVFATESLPLSVTVCADEVCQTQRIDFSNVEPGQRFVAVYARVNLDDEERERDVAVTLEVRSDNTGEMLADASGTGHLQRTQPNGASCGPTCYFAHLTYDDTSKALVA